MMRPRKTLNACAVGAVAICYLLSPPVFARLQSAGEQPPSIIPKYEAPRGGSGPGTSIPDDLWKGDRSTPGSIGGPTSNLSGPGNGSISQPPQTQSAQTQQANPQSQQPQPQSSTQSQSTLRLANHFPNTNQPQANNTNAINNGAGNSNQTSNFNQTLRATSRTTIPTTVPRSLVLDTHKLLRQRPRLRLHKSTRLNLAT